MSCTFRKKMYTQRKIVTGFWICGSDAGKGVTERLHVLQEVIMAKVLSAKSV